MDLKKQFTQSTNVILKEYEKQEIKYQRFGLKLKSIIEELLSENKEISIQYISHRNKDLKSLEKKINSKAGRYSSLEDITDLCGVRIIAYLPNSIDKIATIIKNNLKVDESNSIDKRVYSDFAQTYKNTTEFGYSSLHYVISLKKDRECLPEYKQYIGLKCEVQIRTVLEHAWAEIEHDIGYKGNTTPEYKREFSRLSAVLEQVDSSFESLEEKIQKYESNVNKKISKNAKKVSINPMSLQSLMLTNKTLGRLSKIITGDKKIEFEENSKTDELLEGFSMLGIENIEELQLKLKKYNNKLEYYLKEGLEKNKPKLVSTNYIFMFIQSVFSTIINEYTNTENDSVMLYNWGKFLIMNVINIEDCPNNEEKTNERLKDASNFYKQVSEIFKKSYNIDNTNEKIFILWGHSLSQSCFFSNTKELQEMYAKESYQIFKNGNELKAYGINEYELILSTLEHLEEIMDIQTKIECQGLQIKLKKEIAKIKLKNK